MEDILANFFESLDPMRLKADLKAAQEGEVVYTPYEEVEEDKKEKK